MTAQSKIKNTARGAQSRPRTSPIFVQYCRRVSWFSDEHCAESAIENKINVHDPPHLSFKYSNMLCQAGEESAGPCYERYKPKLMAFHSKSGHACMVFHCCNITIFIGTQSQNSQCYWCYYKKCTYIKVPDLLVFVAPLLLFVFLRFFAHVLTIALGRRVANSAAYTKQKRDRRSTHALLFPTSPRRPAVDFQVSI